MSGFRRVSRERDERGVSMITVVVALAALLAAGAFALDVGMIWTSRTQLQAAADSAALAAATELIIKNPKAVDLAAARAAGIAVASANQAGADTSIDVPTANFSFGTWDFATRTLDTSVDLGDPDVVDAVRVVVNLDNTENTAAPALLGGILGFFGGDGARSSYNVAAEATAFIKFAGNAGPGEVDLPIAIDCCKLRGPNCEADYCETIQVPPNECQLNDVQNNPDTNTPEPNPVSCINFHDTNYQNACWTAFDDESASVNTPDLSDLVEGPIPPVSTDDAFYLDNGTKTPVIQDIYDKMNGTGSYSGKGPAGKDYYLPQDGTIDSWPVVLPVVECQTEDHCAKGTVADIVGFVCFEIREVLVTPEKEIRGRFLCEGDPRWDECEIGGSGTGGDDFNILADNPVLVN